MIKHKCIYFSYFRTPHKGRAPYPGSGYNCSGLNTTRAERRSCVGLEPAATASLHTGVVGLRLTPSSDLT